MTAAITDHPYDDTATIATLTITEKADHDAQLMTWTARHNRKIVGTTSATLYTTAMHTAAPLRRIIAAAFGVSPHHVIISTEPSKGRFRIVPQHITVIAPITIATDSWAFDRADFERRITALARFARPGTNYVRGVADMLPVIRKFTEQAEESPPYIIFALMRLSEAELDAELISTCEYEERKRVYNTVYRDLMAGNS